MSWRPRPADPLDALAMATATDDFAELYAPLARAETELLEDMYSAPEAPGLRPPGDPELLALKAAERARCRGRKWPEGRSST